MSATITNTPDLATYSDDELLDQISQTTDDLRAYLEEAVRRGLSQARIAHAMGCSQQTVSRRMRELGVTPTRPTQQPPRVPKDEYSGGQSGDLDEDEWTDEDEAEAHRAYREREERDERAAREAQERIREQRERVRMHEEQERARRAQQARERTRRRIEDALGQRTNPDTPDGKAADKAEKLLAKAAAVNDPERSTFANKAFDLIRDHKLNMRVVPSRFQPPSDPF
jgi:hypothetical protein